VPDESCATGHVDTSILSLCCTPTTTDAPIRPPARALSAETVENKLRNYLLLGAHAGPCRAGSGPGLPLTAWWKPM